MSRHWIERNTIVAYLFNPAFCGEIIRVVIKEYNKHTNTKFPFAFAFIILPILLHEKTRERLPRSVKTYFFVWIEQNDDLFFDFSTRSRSMVRFTKEALIFAITYKKIILTEKGEFESVQDRVRYHKNDHDYEEYNMILKKAEMLGKWLSFTTDINSIYSFLRIIP